MAPRCPFCSTVFSGDYPHKVAGVHTVLCGQCGRAFIIWVKRHWWGWSRETRVR